MRNCPRQLKWKDVFSTKKGGLVETVSLINGIIGGIIGGLFVFYIILLTISPLNKFNNYDTYYIVLTFVLYSFTTWILQFYYIKIEYEKECKKRNEHLRNRGQHY